jgi:hypothetical protein
MNTTLVIIGIVDILIGVANVGLWKINRDIGNKWTARAALVVGALVFVAGAVCLYRGLIV